MQSLLEAGTYDGSLYAAPYYAGARIMIYRKDLFEASGIECRRRSTRWSPPASS